MQLFREEVLQARTASFLGVIRVGRPPGFAATTLGALLLGTLLVAFAAWGHVTRKATLPGVLVPEQGVLHIGAPRPGRVAELRAAQGQHVAEGHVLLVLDGQTLATVLPHEGGRASPLQAHLYAASRTAGFVQAGQRVRLRYDAYPYQKFGMGEGLIASLSHTPIAPHELPPGIPGGPDSMYRITVDLGRQSIEAYGRPHALKPGMTLQADVLQDRRAIWEWLLEPLISVLSSSDD